MSRVEPQFSPKQAMVPEASVDTGGAPLLENMKEANVTDLAAKVKSRRAGGNAKESIRAMDELLKKWVPNGKQVGEIKSLLGKPNEKKDNMAVYMIDTGSNRYEWTFNVEKGVVSSVKLLISD